MRKETFIIRTEWMDSILELPDEDKATILKNLFYFHSENENLINLKNLSVKLVWKLIEPNLQRNINQYDKRCLTSIENGKKGGRPRNLKKPKKPNETLSDLDLDSDLVIDNDSDLDNVNEENIKAGGKKNQENNVKGKPSPFFENFKLKYLEWKNKQGDIPYVWSGKDNKAMGQLISKIKQLIFEKEKNSAKKEKEYTSLNDIPAEEVLGALSYILANMPEWYKANNSSISVINSNLNEIIQQIKSNKNGKSNTNSVDESKRRALEALARRYGNKNI